uniref:Uncharacterized protein n=1 Tax=Nomascus leucogenys TaxID=61853 RepID=A0A2I3GMR7_NOMLE
MLTRPVDTLFSLMAFFYLRLCQVFCFPFRFSPTYTFCSSVYPVSFSVTLCYPFLSLVISASPSFLSRLLIHMGDWS